MKRFKLIYSLLISYLFIAYSCQEDDPSLGSIIAPSNIAVAAEIVGQDASNPNGDGSGVVNFTATAQDAITYKFVAGGIEQVSSSGEATFTFTSLGVNTYDVTVVAFGTGGVSSSISTTVEVLATYSPPQDLLDKLLGDGTRVWRIKSEAQGHFGLGPVGGVIPTEWYGAGPEEKAGVGMYDDRYIFNSDGTFTHITDNTNDDPMNDPSGTVFGREVLIEELAGAAGDQDGADILNYPYNDYSENWQLIAPSGVETIMLTGKAFIGYYTGGNHQYQIFDRSVPGELLLKTTDGNGEFDWWFIITYQEPGGSSFTSNYNNLIWQDEFDTNGAPDSSNWTAEIGTGTNGWGNFEEQYYTDDSSNLTVEDGLLKITAEAESFMGSNYTSARITTQDKFEFTYGRVEIRAKLPQGGGTWPALWMLGANFPDVGWPVSGEIDIMEHVGNNQNEVLATVHWDNGGSPANFSQSTNVSGVSDDFHIYTLEWRPDELLILVDDMEYFSFSYDSSFPFDQDFFMIFNVAMGGTLGGTIDSGFTQSTMEVDYVRVYQ